MRKYNTDATTLYDVRRIVFLMQILAKKDAREREQMILILAEGWLGKKKAELPMHFFEIISMLARHALTYHDIQAEGLIELE
jgi:hypothetical protein